MYIDGSTPKKQQEDKNYRTNRCRGNLVLTTLLGMFSIVNLLTQQLALYSRGEFLFYFDFDVYDKLINISGDNGYKAMIVEYILRMMYYSMSDTGIVGKRKSKSSYQESNLHKTYSL